MHTVVQAVLDHGGLDVLGVCRLRCVMKALDWKAAWARAERSWRAHLLTVPCPTAGRVDPLPHPCPCLACGVLTCMRNPFAQGPGEARPVCVDCVASNPGAPLSARGVTAAQARAVWLVPPTILRRLCKWRCAGHVYYAMRDVVEASLILYTPAGLLARRNAYVAFPDVLATTLRWVENASCATGAEHPLPVVPVDVRRHRAAFAASCDDPARQASIVVTLAHALRAHARSVRRAPA
jgi:hypothetical protein